MEGRDPAAARTRSVAENRARAKAWYHGNRLEWTVKVENRVVAQFADRRNALGFASARYKGEADVLRRHSRKRVG